jgi:hypothetical protein
LVERRQTNRQRNVGRGINLRMYLANYSFARISPPNTATEHSRKPD